MATLGRETFFALYDLFEQRSRAILGYGANLRLLRSRFLNPTGKVASSHR
jgi:hypothetical protein